MFLDILALGDTGTKCLVFLLFLASLSAVGVLKEQVGNDTSLKQTKRCLVLLLVLLVVALTEHLWLLSTVGMDWSLTIVAAKNYNYSGSQLLNVHTAKAILGQWVKDSPLQFDAGVAFVPYFPRYVLVLHFCLFLAACLQLLRAWTEVRSAGESFVFALSSFVVILNCLDGGLLNPQAIVAFSALLAVLNKKVGSLFFLTVFSLQMLSWAQYDLSIWDLALRTFGPLLLLLTGYGVCVFKSKKQQWASLLSFALIIVLFAPLRFSLVPGTGGSGMAWSQINRLLRPIAANEVFHITLLGPIPEQDTLEVLSVQTAGPYRLVKVRALEETTVIKVSWEWRTDLFRESLMFGAPPPFRLETDVYNAEKQLFEPLILELPVGCTRPFLAALLGPEPRLFRGLFIRLHEP